MEKPTTNVLKINCQRSTVAFVWVTKSILEVFDTAELHGLGNAITSTAIVADNLQLYGYATISRILLSTEDVKRDDGFAKKSKIVITLKRSPEFQKKAEEFNHIMASKPPKSRRLKSNY
jgi:hypothetical protein